MYSRVNRTTLTSLLVLALYQYLRVSTFALLQDTTPSSEYFFPDNDSSNNSLGYLWDCDNSCCAYKYILTKDTVQPICLIGENEERGPAFTRSPTSTTGWGHRTPFVNHVSRFLKYMTSLIISNSECTKAWDAYNNHMCNAQRIRFTSSCQKMPGQVDEPKANRATFGMGCFWAGDSLFGATPGVIRTCVGYAGGDKPSPTYRNIGDHTEVIDIHYDPAVISYSQLLNLFWNNHEYGLTKKIKRQYTSLILYHDEEQRNMAEKSKAHGQRERGELFVTEIKKFETFYPAEDYHQKYRLQGHPWLVEMLGFTCGEVLRTSPLASRLNGYIAGAGTIEQFEKELPSLNLSEKTAQYLRKCVNENQGNGLYC